MTSQAAIIAAPARPAAWRLARDLLVLTKPRITLSSTLAAAAGLAAQGPGGFSASSLLALAGVSLTVAAACTFNMWLERDTDALMERTSARPLPAQRLEARAALGQALLLSLAGLAMVMIAGSVAAAGLSLAALLLYSFAYTPLKRITPAASLVGVIPGAMPPLIGAALLGTPSMLAWTLSVLLVLWQIPHLMAVALRLRDQYAVARLHTLLDWLGEARTRVLLRAGFAVLVPAALLPLLAGINHGSLWVGSAFSSLIALCGLVRSLTDGPSGFRTRWYVLATVLYVVPLIVGAIHAGLPERLPPGQSEGKTATAVDAVHRDCETEQRVARM
jgi:protoheme IX farnesyltransferase